MILNGALLLLVRSTSTALLLEVGGRYAASYYLADWTIFFAQKWLRNDAGLFPKVSENSLVQSLFGTLFDWMDKVIVDFTGLVFQMQPGMVGGIYWTTSMVSSAKRSDPPPPPPPYPNTSHFISCAGLGPGILVRLGVRVLRAHA
jgi:hypothetical protein